MKEDKEIGIPLYWLKEKSIHVSPGDTCSYKGNKTIVLKGMNDFSHPFYKDKECVITEFAERENTGVQPVDDDVPVIVRFTECSLISISNTAKTNYWKLENSYNSGKVYIKNWKPDIEALHEMYLSEVECLPSKASSGILRKANEVYNEQLTSMVEDDKELAEKHNIDICPLKSVITKAIDWRMSQINNKGETMSKLKLTKDDIGKYFKNKGDGIVELVACSDRQAISMFESGHFSIHSLDGICIESGGILLDKFSIIKRYEHRWWLKDLPDADLFHDDVLSIRSSENKWQYIKKSWVVFHEIQLLKMPYLSRCEDINASEITIDELRELQKKNK